MSADIQLSPAFIQTDIVREAPRPVHLQQEDYAAKFDWKTLFYDVYRLGEHVVLQGPPLFNLLDELKRSQPFDKALRWPFRKAKHIGHNKRGEIWLRSSANHIRISGPLGHFDLAVQPDASERFADKRVLLTQSKDNEVAWIIDWIRYHQRLHGVDAVLFYENNSTIYDRDELQAKLSEAIRDIDVLVVDWPYIYGPQAGPHWAVNGEEPDWDSDFCQVGMLQHARFRFLQKARSVMHNDIDELVIANGPRSVYEAAEADPAGMIKFEGRWISAWTEGDIDTAHLRHSDFLFDEGLDKPMSTGKWCSVPRKFERRETWGVHNIFGKAGNNAVTAEFVFRHFRGLTNNWHYDRTSVSDDELATLVRDEALVAAMAAAGLMPDSGKKAQSA
ncbi:MAG: glycosyltransferase family 92 protein [Sphingomonadaceae bacterium]